MSTSSSITTLILTFFLSALQINPYQQQFKSQDILFSIVLISGTMTAIKTSDQFWPNFDRHLLGYRLHGNWKKSGLARRLELLSLIVECFLQEFGIPIRKSWFARNKWKTRITKVSYVFQWNIDFFTHNNDFTQIYSSIPEHWLGCCSSSSNRIIKL